MSALSKLGGDQSHARIIRVLTIRTFSIVAVHGLAGGSLSTWRHDNGKTWLLEFLPQDLPNARIMTFGYSARDAYIQPHNSGQKSYGRVMTVAETLCSDLSDCRTSQVDIYCIADGSTAI